MGGASLWLRRVLCSRAKREEEGNEEEEEGAETDDDDNKHIQINSLHGKCLVFSNDDAV